MKAALLGFGTVGKGVAGIIDQGRDKDTAGLEIVRILKRTPADDPRITLDYRDIEACDAELVAECMGGLEPAHTYVRKALEAGRHVVTANKKMLAEHYIELAGLAKEKGVRLLFEATAGGGIPWMAALRRLRRIDDVQSFRGILNGTTNYILSAMTDAGLDFGEMLKKAQELGYAEADPTDDIDGYDVRYKTVLSAIAAFDAAVRPETVPALGIRHISAADIAWGREHGRIVKLIASGEKKDGRLSLYVMPQFLPDTDVLARIGRNFNGVEAVSTTLGPSTYIGQGAGRLPTGHAMVQDMLTIAKGEEMTAYEAAAAEVDNSRVEKRFYIRTVKPEVFAGIMAEAAGTGAFVTECIPLNDLLALIRQADDPELFAAVVAD